MSRSIVIVSTASLLFLASLFGAFTMGTSLNQAQPVATLHLSAHQVQVANPAEPQTQEGAGAPAKFTYQGVLTDLNGQPVFGPVSLQFQILADPIAGGPRVPIATSTIPGITPDSAGRFQIEADLPSTQVMSEHDTFGLRISDASSGSVIAADIPMNPAPYAWLSEHARTSDIAYDLAGNQIHDLTLTGDFVFNTGLGQPPKAVRVGQVVMLTGTMFSDVSNTNGAEVGFLPVGMRPSQTVILPVHVNIAPQSGNAALVITSSGRITILSPNYGAGYTFFLNGANFIVE